MTEVVDALEPKHPRTGGKPRSVRAFGVTVAVSGDAVTALRMHVGKQPTDEFLGLFPLIVGDREAEIRDALREPSGKLRASKVVAFVADVLNSLS